MINESGADKLYINWPWSNTFVKVTYTGVGNYSTDDTDLYIERSFNNGLSTLFLRSDYFDCPQCGGYMEILSDDGDYIEGNLRYLIADYSSGSNSVETATKKTAWNLELNGNRSGSACALQCVLFNGLSLSSIPILDQLIEVQF